MNVLHISENFITGGIESFLVDLCRTLSPGVNFKLACLYGQDSYRSLPGQSSARKPFDVVALGMKRRLRVDPLGVLRLSKLIRSFDAELLHCHSYYAVLAALLARPFTGRIPIVYTVHATLWPGKQRSDAIVRWVARACDTVIAVSQSSARGIKTLAGVNPVVIINGIEPRRVEPPAGFQREEYRRKIGIEPDALVLLNVASLTVNKDQATLVRALQHVRETIASVVLVIAGTGTELNNLQALIHSLGLNDSVRVLGIRSDIAELLSAADIFTLSSRSEGMAISVLEACLSGVPVVCTAVGAAEELQSAGLDLTLAPPADVGALAKAIIKVASRSGPMQEKKERAHSLISIERAAAAYLSVYRAYQGRYHESRAIHQLWQ